jgi:transcriptional regulator with XRE-family HTH domain
MKVFGNRLKKLRDKEGLYQTDVAKGLGISQASVNAWENDKRQPSIDMILKICDYFKVTPNYLFGFEPDDF